MKREELKHGDWVRITEYPLPGFVPITFQVDFAYGDNPVIYFIFYPAPGRTVSEHIYLEDLLPYLHKVEQPVNREGFNPNETQKEQNKRKKAYMKTIKSKLKDNQLEIL